MRTQAGAAINGSSMPETTFYIEDLDCASEEQQLRAALKSLEGIEGLRFNFISREMTAIHREGLEATIEAAILSLGMQVGKAASGTQSCGACSSGTSNEAFDWRSQIQLGLSGLIAFSAEALSLINSNRILVAVVALVSIILGGLPTLRKGYLALRTGSLNINFLMTIAVTGAFVIGEFPEAAVVIFLFAVAEVIEKYSLDRARNAIAKLLESAPDVAWTQSPSGEWGQQASSEIVKGTLIEIRADEKIPLDGVIEEGRSVINQAPVTGESAPAEKEVGDSVYAGTINGAGLLRVRTSGGKDETTIARIVKTVQDAQGERAPTQRFIDSFAKYYTPIVIVFALLIALLGPIFTGQSLFPWLYQALVLLVIACPCALVISTPVTIVSGLAAAARSGILIKGGVYLEIGRKLSLLALDKTGTITEGKPKLVDVLPLHGMSKDEVLKLAASLDATSNHPVAKAIVAGWSGARFPVDQISSVTGRGVTGAISGAAYFIGNHRFVEERKVCSPDVEKQLAILENQGKTVVILGNTEKSLAVFGVSDTPRSSSRAAIAELNGIGIQTVMLSGDNQLTAQAIGAAVGINESKGDLLPEDKLEAIDAYIAKHQIVGMVGDGVNDAPALAKASIGFAMGAAGSDTAIETADVAIMNDDLRTIPIFIRLSKKTHSILVQNISVALGAKLLFFLLAIFGHATLWAAVLADMGVSLLVVANALRLLRSR